MTFHLCRTGFKDILLKSFLFEPVTLKNRRREICPDGFAFQGKIISHEKKIFTISKMEKILREEWL